MKNLSSTNDATKPFNSVKLNEQITCSTLDTLIVHNGILNQSGTSYTSGHF